MSVVEIRDAEEIWWEDVVFPQLDSELSGGAKQYDNLDFDLFDYQNFHPELTGKDIGAGSWVRIKTVKGWEVHWAKKSTRVMDVSPLKRKYKKLEKLELSLETSLEASAKQKLKVIEEKIDILKKIAQAEIIEGMDEQPKYVRIQRTRTQARYLLPKEYEVVNEIELYSDAVISKACKKGIFFKALFTAQDNNVIHYLRSRGISKETAEMMAKMKHGYFVLNQNELVSNVFTAV